MVEEINAFYPFTISLFPNDSIVWRHHRQSIETFPPDRMSSPAIGPLDIPTIRTENVVPDVKMNGQKTRQEGLGDVCEYLNRVKASKTSFANSNFI